MDRFNLILLVVNLILAMVNLYAEARRREIKEVIIRMRRQNTKLFLRIEEIRQRLSREDKKHG